MHQGLLERQWSKRSTEDLWRLCNQYANQTGQAIMDGEKRGVIQDKAAMWQLACKLLHERWSAPAMFATSRITIDRCGPMDAEARRF